MKIEPTLRDFVQDPTEQICTVEEPDVFENFSGKAALAAHLGGHEHVEALKRETQKFHAEHAASYQKIEAAAAPAPSSSGELKKRFGGVRMFFAERRAAGDSV
jgi:hypothetical protein